MAKIGIIENCDCCNNFDNSYWGYEEKCKLLNRRIPQKNLGNPHDIPSDCPLEDAPKVKE